MSEERWMPVAGFPGYDVSDMGRVRSWRLSNGRRTDRRRTEPVLKAFTFTAGYSLVGMMNDAGKQKRVLVHRLVLDAFVGHCPEGMECCHGNGDRSDNRLVNLRWDTRVANAADRKSHGTDISGLRHHRATAKLNKEKIADVVELLLKKVPQREIASLHGVAQQCISKISTGKRWAHLTQALRSG